MDDALTTNSPPPAAPPRLAAPVLSVLLAAALGLLLFPSGAFGHTPTVVALLLTTAWALCALRDRHPSRPPAPAPQRRLAWGLAVAALVGLAYVVPLPVGLSAIGSPRRQVQNTAVDEALKTAAAMDWLAAETQGYALTRNKAGSVRWSLMMLGAAAAAMLVARLPAPARLVLMRALVLGGVVVAVGGLASLRRWPQGDTLWWIYPVDPALPGPLACFRNRNHFAAFLALLTPVALALVASDLVRRRPLALLADAAALTVMALALVLSLSRGGLLAGGAGVLATVILLAWYRHGRLAGAGAALAALALAALVLTPHPAIRERLNTLRNLRAEDSYQTRLNAWRDSLHIVRAYPIAGVGANGFRLVYPQHRTTSQSAFMTHPENEYVQGLVEGGAIGLLMTLALVVLAWPAAIRPALRTRGPDVWVPLAGLAALTAAAANALVDFPLHIPLYAIPVGMTAGLLLPAPTAAEHPVPSPRARAATAPALLVFAVTAITILAWGRHQNLDSTRWLVRAPADSLARALAWAPTSHLAWFRLGQLAALQRTPESRLFARQCYDRAVSFDPLNYRLWDRVGYARLAVGDRAGARAAFARVKALRDWMWVPDVEDLP